MKSALTDCRNKGVCERAKARSVVVIERNSVICLTLDLLLSLKEIVQVTPVLLLPAFWRWRPYFPSMSAAI